MARESSSPLNSLRYVICVPFEKGVKKPAENSKVWCIGRTDKTPSEMSISKTLDNIEIILTKFLCDNITAFGVPVVPLVKISDATEPDKILFGKSAFLRASSISS